MSIGEMILGPFIALGEDVPMTSEWYDSLEFVSTFAPFAIDLGIILITVVFVIAVILKVISAFRG